MTKLDEIITTTTIEYLNEVINTQKDLTTFLSDKKFINPKSKLFLYHGTKILPENFNLRDDYNWEDSNVWSSDLPEGYLFLTTNLNEAKGYGQYVIPCELKRYDNKYFNVNANNPSQIFDKDYGIDLYMPDKYIGFWEKFEESGKSVLIIKGTDRWTVITNIDNIIPRLDLAVEFYNNQSINEDSNDEVKKLQKQLKELDNWFGNFAGTTFGAKYWDDKVEEANEIRKKLYQLTGDPYGETKEDKAKKNIKPNGLNKRYDYPTDVPKNVYRWILNNLSLLYSDATDAVRWSRIINSKDDARYRGDITIYRAVDNHNYDDIREGDWVTTDERYAIEHNNRYFNGKGKILSMDVNGRDVLISPTGNNEEAIYAPLKYSIDVKL